MRDACAVGGWLLLSVGAGLAWLPAGLMVGGSVLLAAGLWGHLRVAEVNQNDS
jgi:hypothetical protein